MQISISGVHTKITKDVEKYINKKIAKIEKYLPKKAKENIKTEVKIKKAKKKGEGEFMCEVIVHLPKGAVTVHEIAQTEKAAVDAAEARLKIQLKKYKDKYGGPRIHRRVLGKLKRQG